MSRCFLAVRPDGGGKTIRARIAAEESVTSRSAAGHLTTTLFHPALGVPGVLVDLSGARTVRQYDRFGRFRRESLPGGGGVTAGCSSYRCGSRKSP
jgi:hypothetical protein